MYEHQTSWQERAAQVKGTPNQEWTDLLRANLQRCHPHMATGLAMRGDLEAYLTVMVNQATQDYQANLESGMSQPDANELAMADLLRPAEAETEAEPEEDWDLEGATADIAAAMEKRLLEHSTPARP